MNLIDCSNRDSDMNVEVVYVERVNIYTFDITTLYWYALYGVLGNTSPLRHIRRLLHHWWSIAWTIVIHSCNWPTKTRCWIWNYDRNIILVWNINLKIKGPFGRSHFLVQTWSSRIDLEFINLEISKESKTPVKRISYFD